MVILWTKAEHAIIAVALAVTITCTKVDIALNTVKTNGVIDASQEIPV